MSSLKLQLLYFDGCPNVELARVCAQSVLEDFPSIKLEEVDVRAAATPPELQKWGSPTLLLAGRDIAGESPAGACCRLYDSHHPDSRGVPSPDLIRRALRDVSG